MSEVYGLMSCAIDWLECIDPLLLDSDQVSSSSLTLLDSDPNVK